VEGSIANPQSLNRYTYVQNDPVNMTDPDGLIPCLINFRHNQGDQFIGEYNRFPTGTGLNEHEEAQFDEERNILAIARLIYNFEPVISFNGMRDAWTIDQTLKIRGFAVYSIIYDPSTGKPTKNERKDFTDPVQTRRISPDDGSVWQDPNTFFVYLRRGATLLIRQFLYDDPTNRTPGTLIKLIKANAVFTYAYDVRNVTGTKGCSRTIKISFNYIRGVDSSIRITVSDGFLSGFGN
jgi:hypothetical protein